MTDDLVKRLRSKIIVHTDAAVWMLEAADRIEELEAELHLMKTAGIVEVAIRNPNVSEYMAHWERRAEGAEAKLAKAVDALERIGSGEFSGQVLTSMPPQDAAVFFALTALAEIKGETK